MTFQKSNFHSVMCIYAYVYISSTTMYVHIFHPQCKERRYPHTVDLYIEEKCNNEIIRVVNCIGSQVLSTTLYKRSVDERYFEKDNDSQFIHCSCNVK